jgi:hypothetical protein
MFTTGRPSVYKMEDPEAEVRFGNSKQPWLLGAGDDMPQHSGIAANLTAAELGEPVHRPDRCLTGIVLPEYVVLAVAVEITGSV